MLELTRYPGQTIVVTHEPSGECFRVTLGDVEFGSPIPFNFTGDPDRFVAMLEGNEGSAIGPDEVTEDLLRGERLFVQHSPTGDRVKIELLGISPDRQTRVGLQAKRCFLIDRQEIYEDKNREAKR